MGKYYRGKHVGKSNFCILLMSLITAVAVSVTIWALFFREPEVILAPDYAPKETEAHAQTIPNDDSEKMQSEEGGGSVSLTYSNQVAIDLSDGVALLMFANPNKSNQDIVLQIVVQNEVIVQSGIIPPGHQVTALNLMEGAETKLSSGGYDGYFDILYYNPENGERAIINTEIPILIEVNN